MLKLVMNCSVESGRLTAAIDEDGRLVLKERLCERAVIIRRQRKSPTKPGIVQITVPGQPQKSGYTFPALQGYTLTRKNNVNPEKQRQGLFWLQLRHLSFFRNLS